MQGSASGRKLRHPPAWSHCLLRSEQCEAVTVAHRQDHPAGFDAHEFGRFEVGHQDHLFSHQNLRLVGLGKACHHLAFLTDIHNESQQLLGIGNGFRLPNETDPQIHLLELIDGD